MSAASLIGFGVVFLLVCWTASAVLALLVTTVGRRGPAVERRMAELAAVVPVALACAVVGILAVESVVGIDHCDSHGHHAHLCIRHGIGWAERPWAVAAVVAGVAVVGARGLLLVIATVRGHQMVSRLRAAVVGDARVQLVTSERVFCFVAGLVRPTIYVSTAARDALSPEEWSAMLAHEQSHVANRDLMHRLGLELLLLLAAPLAGIVIRERWDAATERLRDTDAAEQASPEAVASALVHMARAQALPPLGGIAAFTPTGEQLLTTRVEALLDGAPRGVESARRLARVALASSVVVVTLAFVFAQPLHHALETLLG